MGRVAIFISHSITLFLYLSWGVYADSPHGVEKLSDDVKISVQSAQPGDMISVIVRLNTQTDLTGSTIQAEPDRSVRLNKVIRELQKQATLSQQAIRVLLSQRQVQGFVSRVTYYWIFNGFEVTATPNVIYELAARPEVLSITPNEVIQAPSAPSPQQGELGVLSIEPNLSLINVSALWTMGYKGEGIVVANVDTGVDINHPQLGPKWRGGANSWFDPYGQNPTPADFNGHGTWTMGVIVGGEDNGDAFGVAPEATWIAAKIFDNAGSATMGGIHTAYQWLLDPDNNPNTPDAPHVVNSSWTFATPGCNLEFQDDVRALRAVGILPVFAAGNSGPNGFTGHSPANYPESFAVGAIDNINIIKNDSSRGPSSCGEAQTIFPEVVAPGVGIHTTDLSNQYINQNGTSLAAPHVVGALALLLNAYPNLTVTQQENALLNSVIDLGAAGPDNTYGYGRIDILASFQTINSVYLPVILN